MLLKVNKKSNISLLLAEIDRYLQNIKIKKSIAMEITTLSSELIYNIYKYTPHGSIEFKVQDKQLYIIATDKGSGIDDVSMAIKDGYSTSGTLGLGFASIFRLSDTVDIQTSDDGTTISIQKSLV